MTLKELNVSVCVTLIWNSEIIFTELRSSYSASIVSIRYTVVDLMAAFAALLSITILEIENERMHNKHMNKWIVITMN